MDIDPEKRCLDFGSWWFCGAKRMKKIFMAGCGGMLGEAFFENFINGYHLMPTDIDVNENWLRYCDIRNLSEYGKQVFNYNPDYLFHLGALTDLEQCEGDIDNTYMTNTIGVENAVYIANQLKIPLLYISTAGIFDGKKQFYDDWDIPNPLCHYARSKYAGELYVRENCHKYLVCRASWMIGGGPKKDKKFVGKIMRQIKDGKKELFVVNDKLGTPTYSHDFVSNVRLLLESELWGTYNMACSGPAGRCVVAEEILKILGLSDTIKINEVPSAYFANEYFATRPKSEWMVNSKLNLRKANLMRDWRVCLKEYLNSYWDGYLGN